MAALESDARAAGINLLKSAVGSGIIGLPYALMANGYLLFPILNIMCFAVSYKSLDILIQVCDHYDVSCYEDLFNEVLAIYISVKNFGRRACAVIVMFATSIANTAFLFISKSQLPEIIKYLLLALGQPCLPEDTWYLNGNNLVFLIVWCALIPAGFARHMGFLKFTSGIGFLIIFFCSIVVVVFKFKVSCTETIESYDINSNVTNRCGYVPKTATLADWKKFTSKLDMMAEKAATDEPYCISNAMVDGDSIGDAMTGIHNMLYAWYFHINALVVYAELKNRSRPKMMSISLKAMSIVFIMYTVFAYLGYFTWYEATIPELFLTYSQGYNNNVIIFLARLGIVASVLATGMMCQYVTRKAFSLLCFDEYTLNLESTVKHGRRDQLLRFGFPIVYLNCAGVVVVMADSLQTFWSFGGVIAALMMMVSPCTFWLVTFVWRGAKKIEGVDMVVGVNKEAMEKQWRYDKYAAIGILMIGLTLLTYDAIALF